MCGILLRAKLVRDGIFGRDSGQCGIMILFFWSFCGLGNILANLQSFKPFGSSS